jgi:hypothetical protein
MIARTNLSALLMGMALAPCLADTADIPAGPQRAVVVERAVSMAKPTNIDQAQLTEPVRNPFSAAPVDSRDLRSNRPTNDKELLAVLADQLQPTGVMGREGSMVLLLKGQKGVKVNEKLTVSFDGVGYDVEVVDIDRNNFSLRYNQAEVTRPIKTGKNP